VFPPPNYVFRCSDPNCGEEVTGHEDPEYPQLTTAGRNCPKCGKPMVGEPLVHGGPHHGEHPWKKY